MQDGQTLQNSDEKQNSIQTILCNKQYYRVVAVLIRVWTSGFQTTARGPNASREAILSMMKKTMLKKNSEMRLRKICCFDRI